MAPVISRPLEAIRTVGAPQPRRFARREPSHTRAKSAALDEKRNDRFAWKAPLLVEQLPLLAQSDSESASTETLAPAKAAWSARPPTMSFRLAIGH